MDYSAHAEAQQQEYQPQDHQPAAHSYDPAQAQAYEAYYASYHHNQYDPSAYHHHYYPHDYSSYPTPTAQSDPLPNPAPPSAAAPYDTSQIHPPQLQHHPATAAPPGGHGYPPPPPEQQGPGSSSTSAAASASYPVPPGLNPVAAAAVAALSQLTQFAGTMDAAERAMAGMQDTPWHGKNECMMGPGGPPPYRPHHPHHQPHTPHHQQMQHGAVSIKPGVLFDTLSLIARLGF